MIQPRNIIWWGRFDPEYSRNRILRALLREAGCTLFDFRPRSSLTGTIESFFSHLPQADAVWVPAFRQRDFQSARRFADRRGIPLIFDPLISAWDKVIFERCKCPENSRQSKRLLAWERSLFSRADIVLADTLPHARFFVETLQAPERSTFVVPVSAETSVFRQQPTHPLNIPPEVLFYGSFIGLQGPGTIVEAAALAPSVIWTMIGSGPLLEECRQRGNAQKNLRFEPWLDYADLPARIGAADILLGIFGTSPKAGRVIPNKVYQALACGRPLVTRISEAYPKQLIDGPANGVHFVPAGDPQALAACVNNLVSEPEQLVRQGTDARDSFTKYFSEDQVRAALAAVLRAEP